MSLLLYYMAGRFSSPMEHLLNFGSMQAILCPDSLTQAVTGTTNHFFRLSLGVCSANLVKPIAWLLLKLVLYRGHGTRGVNERNESKQSGSKKLGTFQF